MRWRRAATIGVIAAGLSSSAAPGRAAVPVEPDTTWLDEERLADGDILAETSRDGSTVTVSTAALIAAPVEVIWEEIRSCEVAPEYVPNVVACERIETLDDGRSELFSQTIRPIFFLPRFEHVFRLDYHPYERIDFSEIEGPLEHMEGRWWFLPRPGGKGILVMHTLEVDPGLPVPRFLLRATMRRDLVKILEAIRDRSIQADDG
jgi:hypothetical protein